MRWHNIGPDFGVLAIDYNASNEVEKPEAPVELRVFWGDGWEPTRAAWFWSGTLTTWVDVGNA